MTDPNVTLVLASIDSPTTVEASLNGFLEEVRGQAHIVVVDASRRNESASIAGKTPGIELIRRPAGTLAPVLWKCGLEAAKTEFVAFSTVQMVPRIGWLASLLCELERTGAAAVGGPIAARPKLSSLDRAMYLLRYANYLPPVPDSSAFEPPGDNAIYRRADLIAATDSWRYGFWELEVHKRLRALGRTTSVAHEAVVDFVGGYQLTSALTHRLAHASEFGATRVRNRNVAVKLSRFAIAPAVPPMLLSRILRNLTARGEPLGPWLSALPYLSALLATWSAGEATGALFGTKHASAV